MPLQTATVEIPVAEPLYYDFFTPGKMFDWDVSDQGVVRKIPIAVGVAVVEAPSWFPSFGSIVETDPTLREAAEGVFEVANILESFDSASQSFKDAYVACIRNIGERLKGCSSPSTAISICEETTYDLEVLVGIIQVFGNRPLQARSTIHGVQNVGVWITFPGNTDEQNYNLNYIMVRWLRENWVFPFLSPGDTRYLVAKFGFDATSLQIWLENSRQILWEPIATGASSTICFHIEGRRRSIGGNGNTKKNYFQEDEEQERRYSSGVALAELIPGANVMKCFCLR